MVIYKSRKKKIMPNCRECGSRISKFDKDICPVCGCRYPLDASSNQTQDITSQIDINSDEFKQYKPHKRMVAFILSCFLGWLGAPLFYLGYIKSGILWMLTNLALIAILGSVFAFGLNINIFVSYLVVGLVTFIVLNALIGFYYLFKNDLKDSKGEFLL